jgi:hypothetical protein
MRPSTISQIGAFNALSNTTLDYLALAPSRCSGYGDPPQRTTVEPAPGRSGALIYPPLDDAWIITLAGDLNVTSTGLSTEGGYREVVEAMFAELKAAIAEAAVGPIDLVHDGGTLKVWKYGPVEQSWDDLETVCSVTFSLVVDVFAA